MIRIYTDSTEVKESIEVNKYVFDFGTKPKDSTVAFSFFVKAEDIQNMTAQSTCGCIVPAPKKINDGLYEISVQYKNTHIKKPFAKSIIVNFKSKGVDSQVIAVIKGIIS